MKSTPLNVVSVSTGAPKAPNDAHAYLPDEGNADLADHRRAVQRCRGCDLYKSSTQGVFGEGNPVAEIMFIGEQPGNQEDLQGRPFVGPAGKLLDRALVELDINRADVYVTNAVKHFKWTPAPRGKRRLHVKLGLREIHACHPWLEREILLLKPRYIVCLGATAGQALFCNSFRLGTARGEPIRDTQWAPCVIATAHPSAILRIPDHAARASAYQSFLDDLRLLNYRSATPSQLRRKNGPRIHH